MKKHLLKYGKQYIYHFTDKRNIHEIKKHGGLMPRAMLNNIPYVPGGNQWSIDADNCMGMQNYVHLCFLDDHPMEFLARAREEGRIDSIWLEVSTDIFDLPNVKYCAGVANRADAKYLTANEAIKIMDFDHLFNPYDFNVEENRLRHNEAKKYEILVPSKISVELIRGL
jgi:hypothetical protein